MTAVTRSADRMKPPARLAHLGLGAFHRAHQAWYTHRSRDASDWGIVGFTGRRPDVAERLAAQDGVYTLIERGATRDRFGTIESIVAAHPGSDNAMWETTLADPAVAVLTVTVTEAGYQSNASPPSRVAAGLAARRHAKGGPLAVVGCDNLAHNGRALQRAVVTCADAALREWVDENVSFVDSMVDRITPATTPEDIVRLRDEAGVVDIAPVVTEPFAEWVIAGRFPAGRPAWETAGAVFVDDLVPYEQRKLWLLNAAHSLLAYAGRLRGCETVADAFADTELRELVEQLWHEQRALIVLPDSEIDVALDAIRARLANSRIRHHLTQIGLDGPLKLAMRVIDPTQRRIRSGRGPGDAQDAVLDAWVACVERFGAEDAVSADLVNRVSREPAHARREIVRTRLGRILDEQGKRA